MSITTYNNGAFIDPPAFMADGTILKGSMDDLSMKEQQALLEDIYNQLAQFPIPPPIELSDLPDVVPLSSGLDLHAPAPLLPRFTGVHPEKWLAYAERFFTYYKIHNTERFPYVSYYFEDEAAIWFSYFQSTEWSEFAASLRHQFGYSRQGQNTYTLQSTTNIESALKVFDEMPHNIENKFDIENHEPIDDEVFEIQTTSMVVVNESLEIQKAQMNLASMFVPEHVSIGLKLVLADDSSENDMVEIDDNDIVDSFVINHKQVWWLGIGSIVSHIIVAHSVLSDSLAIHSFAWQPGIISPLARELVTELRDEISWLIESPKVIVGFCYDPAHYYGEWQDGVGTFVGTHERLIDQINNATSLTLEHLLFLVIDERDPLLHVSSHLCLPIVLHCTPFKSLNTCCSTNAFIWLSGSFYPTLPLDSIQVYFYKDIEMPESNWKFWKTYSVVATSLPKAADNGLFEANFKWKPGWQYGLVVQLRESICFTKHSCFYYNGATDVIGAAILNIKTTSFLLKSMMLKNAKYPSGWFVNIEFTFIRASVRENIRDSVLIAEFFNKHSVDGVTSNHVTYTTLIATYGTVNSSNAAICLREEIETKWLFSGILTYTPILQHLFVHAKKKEANVPFVVGGIVGGLDHADQGLQLQLCILSLYVSGCKVIAAFRVFHYMPNQSFLTWTTILICMGIHGYGITTTGQNLTLLLPHSLGGTAHFLKFTHLSPPLVSFLDPDIILFEALSGHTPPAIVCYLLHTSGHVVTYSLLKGCHGILLDGWSSLGHSMTPSWAICFAVKVPSTLEKLHSKGFYMNFMRQEFSWKIAWKFHTKLPHSLVSTTSSIEQIVVSGNAIFLGYIHRSTKMEVHVVIEILAWVAVPEQLLSHPLALFVQRAGVTTTIQHYGGVFDLLSRTVGLHDTLPFIPNIHYTTIGAGIPHLVALAGSLTLVGFTFNHMSDFIGGRRVFVSCLMQASHMEGLQGNNEELNILPFCDLENIHVLLYLDCIERLMVLFNYQIVLAILASLVAQGDISMTRSNAVVYRAIGDGTGVVYDTNLMVNKPSTHDFSNALVVAGTTLELGGNTHSVWFSYKRLTGGFFLDPKITLFEAIYGHTPLHITFYIKYSLGCAPTWDNIFNRPFRLFELHLEDKVNFKGDGNVMNGSAQWAYKANVGLGLYNGPRQTIRAKRILKGKMNMIEFYAEN